MNGWFGEARRITKDFPPVWLGYDGLPQLLLRWRPAIIISATRIECGDNEARVSWFGDASPDSPRIAGTRSGWTTIAKQKKGTV